MARQGAKLVAVAALTLAMACGIFTASPASETGPGYCTINNACLSYDRNNSGANFGEIINVGSYDGDFFGCTAVSCVGSGVGVHNGAASVANFNSSAGLLCVYFNSFQSGPSDGYEPYGDLGYYGDLYLTYKNNASNSWMPGTSC